MFERSAESVTQQQACKAWPSKNTSTSKEKYSRLIIFLQSGNQELREIIVTGNIVIAIVCIYLDERTR